MLFGYQAADDVTTPTDYFERAQIVRWGLSGNTLGGVLAQSARFLHRSFGCLESIAWSKSALNPLCAATQATRAVRASRRRGGLAPKRGLRRGETSDRDAER